MENEIKKEQKEQKDFEFVFGKEKVEEIIKTERNDFELLDELVKKNGKAWILKQMWSLK